MSTNPENSAQGNESSQSSPQVEAETASAPETKTSIAPTEAADPKPAAKKIQIGSQRDAAAVPVQPKAVQLAKTAPMAIEVANPVVDPLPDASVNSMDGLSEDLDAEIEAAIGGVSMDSVMGGIAEEEELEFNSRVKGTVTKIHGENVFVLSLIHI